MPLAAFATQPTLAAEVDAFLTRVGAVVLPHGLGDRFDALVTYERELHQAGLAVVAWPEHLGGRGLTPADAAVVAAELGARAAPELVNFVAIEVVAPALLAHATAEQVARWLPPMAPADEVWCQLFSEPDAGSDLASLATRAERTGAGWVISGQKVWCTWGQFAQRGLLLARTGSPESRHRGLTAFALDMRAPGVDVRPLRTMTGVSEFAEVFFDAAPVPDEDRVGAEGQGWAVALAMLAAERGTYAVRRAGVIRSQLLQLLDQARRAAPTPALRRSLVDAAIDLELLDLNLAALVSAMAGRGGKAPDAAITKSALTRAEQSVFACAQALLALDGIAWPGSPPPAVESYLYSRAASIYGGTAQIQRNVIGERLLGLPREPS